MATGLRQDRRHGDAHRLADPQQGRQPARRALHQPLPRRHARASRSATGSGCCCPNDPENYYDLRDLSRPTSRAASSKRADRRSRTTTPSCSRTPRRSRASRRTPAVLLKGDARTTRSRRRRGRDGQPGPARPRRRTEQRDHGAQRRGAPLLPGQADHCEASEGVETGRRRGQGRERARRGSGSRASRRSPSTSASSRSATCRRRRSTSAAPATTRATSSRGPSATSR